MIDDNEQTGGSKKNLPVNTADTKYGQACAFRRIGVRSYIIHAWAELINELHATTAAAAAHFVHSPAYAGAGVRYRLPTPGVRWALAVSADFRAKMAAASKMDQLHHHHCSV